MIVTRHLWYAHDGEDICLFTLAGNKVTLQVSNVGCTIVSIHVQTKQENKNIILSYKTAEEYLNDKFYLGSLIGRVAGRISKGEFYLERNKYSLSKNDGGHHLHGGHVGFNKKIFKVAGSFADDDKAFVKFQYTSAHLEEGYPGNLDTTITISLNKSDEISIIYEAETDQDTIVNLTHHCYYNLSGSADDITIHADRYLTCDDAFIPTGEVKTVNKKLTAAGYNDYFIFSDKNFQTPKVEIRDPVSGLAMMVKTTYPGVLYYTGDYLDLPFSSNDGYCLEAQLYPDAPNHPQFPSILLTPGQHYHHETLMSFRFLGNP